MIFQVVINFCVFLLGIFLLMPLIPLRNMLLLSSLSWFTGWGVVSVIQAWLIMSPLPAYWWLVLGLAVLVTGAIRVILRHWGYGQTFRQDFVDMFSGLSSRSNLFILLGFIIVILIITIVEFRPLTTPDSLQYFALARFYHLIGTFGPDEIIPAGWLFNTRLPFLLSVLNIPYQLTTQPNFSFFPITGIFLISGIFGLGLANLPHSRSRMLIWATSLLLILMSLAFLAPGIVSMHFFYLHSNLTTAAYFTLGAVLMAYGASIYNRRYVFLGICLLAICPLLRKEMLIISLIPVFVTFLFSREWPWKDQLTSLLLYAFIALPFHVWGVKLSGIETLQIKVSGHSDSLMTLVAIVIIVAVFLFPYRVLKNHIHFYGALAIGISALFCTYALIPDRFMQSGIDLAKIILQGIGGWGSFTWPIIFLGCFIFFIARPSFLCRLRKDFVSPCVSKQTKQLAFQLEILFFIIFFFFISRIILYTIFTSPAPFGSGTRVLLHIYPVAIFFMAILGQISILYLHNRAYLESSKRYLFFLLVPISAILFVVLIIPQWNTYPQYLSKLLKGNNKDTELHFFQREKHGDILAYGQFLKDTIFIDESQEYTLIVPDRRKIDDFPFVHSLWEGMLPQSVYPVEIVVDDEYDFILSDNEFGRLSTLPGLRRDFRNIRLKKPEVKTAYPDKAFREHEFIVLEDDLRSENAQYRLFAYHDNGRVVIFTISDSLSEKQ